MEECETQPDVKIITNGYWSEWEPWTGCQFVHFPACIGRKYRRRECMNRTHIEYDNIEYICNYGKKIQGLGDKTGKKVITVRIIQVICHVTVISNPTVDDHCHIHICLVLWTQIPLISVVLTAFIVGIAWEIKHGYQHRRYKRSKCRWKRLSNSKSFPNEPSDLASPGNGIAQCNAVKLYRAPGPSPKTDHTFTSAERERLENVVMFL